MTTLIVAALAILAIVFVLKKRYDSNLPLMFYAVAVVFSNSTDRSVNPFLLYGGLAFALLLRYEFMNPAFAKVTAFFATSSLCLIVYVFLAEVFGDGNPPF